MFLTSIRPMGGPPTTFRIENGRITAIGEVASGDVVDERTRAMGMAGRVIISHAFCLGAPDAELVEPLVAALAKARTAIITTTSASRSAAQDSGGQSCMPIRRLRGSNSHAETHRGFGV